jgi:hypothetical protein
MCCCLWYRRVPTPSAYSLRQRLYLCASCADVVALLHTLRCKSADSFVDLLACEFDACPPTDHEVTRVRTWLVHDGTARPEEQYALATLAVSMGHVMMASHSGYDTNS